MHEYLGIITKTRALISGQVVLLSYIEDKAITQSFPHSLLCGKTYFAEEFQKSNSSHNESRLNGGRMACFVEEYGAVY